MQLFVILSLIYSSIALCYKKKQLDRRNDFNIDSSNAIWLFCIITLFAKSGQYSSSHEPLKTTIEAASNDLYQEFLHKSEKKRSEVYETKTEQQKKPSGKKRVTFKRSQSQKAIEAVQALESTNCVKIMKRQVSEKHLKIYDSYKKVVERVKKPEDGMSNEQFRTKIEAFKARQKRIQKDEEHLIL